MNSLNSPAVTVITPVFNCERFIEETINSVLSCKSKINLEYIVIDDGSTDSTKEILSNFSNKLKLITKVNSGEADSVNLGLELAGAPICLVVNADDPIKDSAIFELSLAAFSEDSSLVATYTDWATIDEEGNTIDLKHTKEFSLQELLGYTNCLPGPGAFFKTEVARGVGGRSKEYRYVSDYDFWLKLSQKGSFKRIPLVLAQWRTHSGSTSVNSGGDGMARERIGVVEDFLNKHSFTPKLERQARAHAYYYAARLCLDFKLSNPRSLLMKSFFKRKSWPERANPIVVLAIAMNPLPRLILTPILARIKGR